MRHKYVVGHNGLHWKFDIEVFALGLDRVQLAAGLLFQALPYSSRVAVLERMPLYSNQACITRTTYTCPVMCPIPHFVAIAFAHNAFHPGSSLKVR